MSDTVRQRELMIRMAVAEDLSIDPLSIDLVLHGDPDAPYDPVLGNAVSISAYVDDRLARSAFKANTLARGRPPAVCFDCWRISWVIRCAHVAGGAV